MHGVLALKLLRRVQRHGSFQQRAVCLTRIAAVHEGDSQHVSRCCSPPVVDLPMPCVQVWNPCFDVTPGTLIEAIITEEGLVPRDTGSGTHRVADFMAARQQQQGHDKAAAGKDA
jgi:translation initiation factor 2B subunit (eIF-2B alpha/beta/delta family)